MYTFDELQALVQEKMNKENFIEEPQKLFEPIDYILEDGGKRLRPVLMLMAINLYKDNIEEFMKPALGIEIFHNYTLLHDDVMDDAELRRGRETVHKKWNSNVAILSGDAAAITAYLYLVSSDDKYLRSSIDTFNKVAMDVCKGQQYDMEFETRMDVTVDEYIRMIELKTGALIAGSLKLGSIFGEANLEEQEMLYKFGMYLGVAFQLQDDNLDVYGDVETFGKKIGGDILCNKKTFLLITAMNLANESQKSRLEALLDSNTISDEKKIEEVTALYNEIGVRDIANKEITSYIEMSANLLNNLSVSDERKDVLLNMVNILRDRIY